MRENSRTQIKVLVVVFKSPDDKITAMKIKREARDENPIYFDHAMTPFTRSLFMKTRAKAKDIGAKAAQFNFGRWIEAAHFIAR